MSGYIAPETIDTLSPYSFIDKESLDVRIVTHYGAKAEAIKQQLPESVFNDESCDEVKIYPTNLVSFRHTNYAKKRLERYNSRIDFCRDFVAAENEREQREQQVFANEKKVEFNKSPADKTPIDEDELPIATQLTHPQMKKAEDEKTEITESRKSCACKKSKSEIVSECPTLIFKNGYILDEVTAEVLAKSKSVKEFNRAFRRFMDKFLSNVTVKNSQLITVTTDRN